MSPVPAPLERRSDWVRRLVLVLSAARARPFGYGDHDCALFWADAVLAVTGVDPASTWRGRYASRKSGQKLLQRAGARSPEDLARRLFPLRTGRVQPGDLAVLDGAPGAHTGGVVQGALVYVLTPEGLGLVGLDRALRVYGVG